MIDPEKELLKSSEGDSYSSARLGKGRIALLIVVAVLIAALAGAWAMFGTQLTAAMTIEKLDDNLWSMEYKGDYGFDGFPATERLPNRQRRMWNFWTSLA